VRFKKLGTHALLTGVVRPGALAAQD